VASVKPFRFGIAPDDERMSGGDWLTLAKRVEDLGYSTLLLADHFVNTLSPVPALAAAAAVTTTLRFGTMVFDNDFRHPAVLAKDAATLDWVSGGRFEPGIGAGWHAAEYAMTAIPFDPPAVRTLRLEEAVAVLKGLWGEDEFTFHGRHYTIEGLNGLPKPVQRPHPPLMIGGGGPRILRLAAREANIVSFAAHLRDGVAQKDSLTAEGIAARVALVRKAAGARFDSLELSNYYATPAIVTDDREAAAERIAARATERFGRQVLTSAEVAASPYYLFGSKSQMIDLLVERRERYGFSYIVFTEDPEPYAPVVAALAGR
jgi:probable F420-dependent oxidoreductase